jgi:hypothetical protein
MPTLFPPEYPDCPAAPLQSFGPVFSEQISRSTMGTLWSDKAEDPYYADVCIAAGLTMLEGFHPRDHLECMLAAQGVAFHAAIMECLAQAMNSATPLVDACKLRASAAQMRRSFTLNLNDLHRLQSKPLLPRPGEEEPPTDDPPPDPETPKSQARKTPARKTPARKTPARKRPAPAPMSILSPSSAPEPPTAAIEDPTDDSTAARETGDPWPDGEPPDLTDGFDLEEDIKMRPDGTPGSLWAYAPKPPEQVRIGGESAIQMALETREKLWRMVNAPPDEKDATAAPQSEPEVRPKVVKAPMDTRLPLDLNEKYLLGDALTNLLTARYDPHAPVPPADLEEDTVVELELISTGGDPELEAEKQALMAAHPEGKPIRIIRLAGQAPPDELPEEPPD